jgi:hypothetical protein
MKAEQQERYQMGSPESKKKSSLKMMRRLRGVELSDVERQKVWRDVLGDEYESKYRRLLLEGQLVKWKADVEEAGLWAKSRRVW